MTDDRESQLKEMYLKEKEDLKKKWAGCNLYIKILEESIDEDTLEVEFGKVGAI